MPNMASRRSYRNIKQSLEKDYTILKLNDVLCPICRSILVEPVTLPCQHGFCLTCFKGTVENANLVCPLCRIRIASWLRKSKKQVSLINTALWEAIKHNYAQHVKNKLDGIDENLEEEARVIVSLPGEIRREYEIQKHKENEEIKKKHEAENKASEDLIKRLKEEEDYQKAVMEEKLKLDEQIARRIAAELAFNSPSTSKVNSLNNSFSNLSKHFGPMDRFLKKDNETVTSQTFRDDYKPTKKFAEKEYTCRVLYLDRTSDQDDIPQTLSPVIKKKIEQIQKSTENEQLNDCFEEDMRYFKPIDKICSQSNGKLPLKVPCKKAYKNKTAKIVSPGGLINFHSNCLESAFTRISAALPDSPENKKPVAYRINLKRRYSKEITQVPNKKRSSKDGDTQLLKKKHTSKEDDTSPTLSNNEQFFVKKISYKSLQKFPKKRDDIGKFDKDRESPPFYGFDNSHEDETKVTIETRNIGRGDKQIKSERFSEGCLQEKYTKNSTLKYMMKGDTDNNTKINGSLWTEDEPYQERLLQEEADLALAKKLQAEFNNYAHYTRSSRKVGRGSIKRQTTLDEILTGPYRVK